MAARPLQQPRKATQDTIGGQDDQGPGIRFVHPAHPLFWLAINNYPYPLYLHLCRRVLEADGKLILDFHPWEFSDVSKFGLPGYTVRDCGGWLLDRLHRLADDLGREAEFVSMKSLLDKKRST